VKTYKPLQFKNSLKLYGCARKKSTTFLEYEQNVLLLWDHLYAEIRSNGYKSVEELGVPITDNIEVAITRFGKILLLDGKHRLIISQLLNLNSVPVVVNVIHKSFYNKMIKSNKNKQVSDEDILYRINKN